MENSADFAEETTVETAQELFENRELKSSDSPTFMFSSNATVITDDEPVKIDTYCGDARASFFQNLKYWNEETRFMSVNNLDNSYYRSIVDMGPDALPFIVEELHKDDTPLVYALDAIFPGTVHYEGYVSLKEACDTWRSILRQIEMY